MVLVRCLMKKINIYNDNSDERKYEIKKIVNMFSSSHINVLIGSGFSMPLLKTLSNIEKDLTDAIQRNDIPEQVSLYKKFFAGSILPLIKNNDEKSNIDLRNSFFKYIYNFADTRDSSTLHKMINIYTTNYDNLIESSLEANKIPYFDGFEGRSPAIFSTTNYGKFFGRQSGISNRSTEITAVNLYKLHGSLFWRQKKTEIEFKDFRNKLEEFEKTKNTGEKYIKEYEKKFAIINPTKEKLNSTLLNINYYDQLRLMSNELEKQNALLISFGFSFADEHIFTIIERTLKINPTLTLILFAYSETDLDNFDKLFKLNKNCICYYLKNKNEEFVNFSLSELNMLLEEVSNEIE